MILISSVPLKKLDRWSSSISFSVGKPVRVEGLFVCISVWARNIGPIAPVREMVREMYFLNTRAYS